MKNEILPYTVGDITFRMLEEKDLPLTLSWRNEPEIRKWFKVSEELTFDEHVFWFSNYKIKKNDYVFLAEKENNIIGQFSIYNIDSERNIAEVGRFIAAPEFKGKGLMEKALRIFIQFVFSEYNLNEIYLEVYHNNEIAFHLYNKIGFKINRESKGLVCMRLLNAER